MKTMIAATDFSEASNHAVAFAADLAKWLKGRLIIFNVVNIVPAVSDALLPADIGAYPVAETDEALTALLLNMKKRVSDEIEIQALYKVGAVVRELDALGRKEEPFAVFIAPESASALQRLLLGANGVAIVRSSAFPVIVVPPAAAFRAFRKVGLAIDLPAAEHLPWQFLRNWLTPFDPQVDIVYVSADVAGTSGELPGAINVGAQLDDCILNYHFLQHKDVAAGIKEYIAKNDPDLLMMYIQKQGIFHKSITKAFMEAPPVPVMFFSPKSKTAMDPLP